MQMQTTGKLHQESSTRDQVLNNGSVNGLLVPVQRKLGATSQRKLA